MHNSHLLLDHSPRTIFNTVSPLPCSHPACSEFCIHLEFLPEIMCKVEKNYKVKECVQLFTIISILWREKEKKTGYLPFVMLLSQMLYYHSYHSHLISSLTFW